RAERLLRAAAGGDPRRALPEPRRLREPDLEARQRAGEGALPAARRRGAAQDRGGRVGVRPLAGSDSARLRLAARALRALARKVALSNVECGGPFFGDEEGAPAAAARRPTLTDCRCAGRRAPR